MRDKTASSVLPLAAPARLRDDRRSPRSVGMAGGGNSDGGAFSRRGILGGLIAAAAAGQALPIWAQTAPAAPAAPAPAANAPAAPPPPLPLAEPEPFDPQQVIDTAKAMAADKFKARKDAPAQWHDLTYAQYRDIRFDSRRSLWTDTDSLVHVDMFAPGIYYSKPVKVHAVQDGQARLVTFDKTAFIFGPSVPADLPVTDDMGYSGIRLRGSLTMEGFQEEYFVMQGASYFRAVGLGQTYGLSARGLAIDTAQPTGEEFPDFVELWIEMPAKDSRTTVIHALLDSPSTTGAYTFSVTPGLPCVIDVTAQLFPRKDLAHAGLAPLTSMFLFDDTNRDRFSDFRPAVHDSDGLLMVNGNGEHLWRPLANPKKLQISSFADQAPKGFGLMQRHRKFSDYADLEALYNDRPSLWIEPAGDWGKGQVTLVEIPADKEIYDNIVAFWQPDQPVTQKDGISFGYRMYWGNKAPLKGDLAIVTDTKIGKAHFVDGYTAVIDFSPSVVLPGDISQIQANVEASTGKVEGIVVQRNPETGGPRLAFHFNPGNADLVEFRAQLRRPTAALSEVWTYRWTA